MPYEDYKWKKVELGDTWKFEEEGKQLLFGKYLGFEENVGANQSKLYKIMLENGETVSMWGSTVIDGRMAQIPVNNTVSVKYLGKVTNERSGREYKDFDIRAAGPAPDGFGQEEEKEEE